MSGDGLAAGLSAEVPASLTAGIVEDPNDLTRAQHAAWDGLAVASARPFTAPGWLLPWWRRLRPAGARLAIGVVHDGPVLVGVAPVFVRACPGGRRRLLPLGHLDCFEVEPLAATGREAAVAQCLAGVFAAAGGGSRAGADGLGRLGGVLCLAGVPAASPWPRLLAERWPGDSVRRVDRRRGRAPVIELGDGGIDGWFAARSATFRQQLRRRRRQLARAGGSLGLVDGPERSAVLADFVRLHLARWRDRGGSRAVRPGTLSWLRDAAAALPAERMRVYAVRSAGGTVAVAVCLAAGTEVGYWLGGFDEGWAAYSPGVLLLAEAARDAAERGARAFCLGAGSQPYKYRLATGERPLVWTDLYCGSGPWAATAFAGAWSASTARTVARRLPDRHRTLLVTAARRVAAGLPPRPGASRGGRG